MKHRVGFNKLSRKSSHRKALHRNMVTSLFKHERITTTKAKALEIRRTAEKMITRAKSDSVHNRRIINKDIKDGEVLNKLFTEIGPRNATRPGGYTRIYKLGFRKGDAAEMVILELVSEEESETKKKKPSKAKKAAEPKAAVKTEVKKDTPVKEEVPVEAPVTEEPAVEEAAVEETEAEVVEDKAAEVEDKAEEAETVEEDK